MLLPVREEMFQVCFRMNCISNLHESSCTVSNFRLRSYMLIRNESAVLGL